MILGGLSNNAELWFGAMPRLAILLTNETVVFRCNAELSFSLRGVNRRPLADTGAMTERQ
jgi:hypothetical protein